MKRIKISRLKRLKRFLEIVRIVHRYGLDEIFDFVGVETPQRYLKWSRFFCGSVIDLPRGVRLRLAFEKLGPIFIKFGQMLSTRLDILPEDVAIELVKLQDKVPPFSGELALEQLQKSLAVPLNEVFAHVDVEPLSSASVAQVHAATLKNGDPVIVKILRPQIHFLIERDIRLMRTLAHWMMRSFPETRRLRLTEVVDEFQITLSHELDLQHEAANCSQLRRNFENSHLLYVPKIYWDHTSKTCMVMERIFGECISDLETLKKRGTDFKVLAERGVEIFFTQVFRDCFFHADMHPGNIFVNIENPHAPRYMAIDFGIMGTLSPEDQYYLASNFLAFFRRDYRHVAKLHIESGWVPRDTRLDRFEAAIRTVCDPIFERPLKDISFGQTLLRLFQTARQFDMQIQPQLVLLQKTLIYIEGLGRQLYPELDLWKTAKPFLEDWMKRQAGPRAWIDSFRRQGMRLSHQLPAIPNLLHDALSIYCTQSKTIPEAPRQSIEPGVFFISGILAFLLAPLWEPLFWIPLLLGVVLVLIGIFYSRKYTKNVL